ncbi:hypothetical protein BJ546DRAFT_321125 [Cryomyces antarcticus]
MCFHTYTHYVCGCIMMQTNNCELCITPFGVLFCEHYETFRNNDPHECGSTECRHRIKLDKCRTFLPALEAQLATRDQILAQIKSYGAQMAAETAPYKIPLNRHPNYMATWERFQAAQTEKVKLETMRQRVKAELAKLTGGVVPEPALVLVKDTKTLPTTHTSVTAEPAPASIVVPRGQQPTRRSRPVVARPQSKQESTPERTQSEHERGRKRTASPRRSGRLSGKRTRYTKYFDDEDEDMGAERPDSHSPTMHRRKPSTTSGSNFSSLEKNSQTSSTLSKLARAPALMMKSTNVSVQRSFPQRLDSLRRPFGVGEAKGPASTMYASNYHDTPAPQKYDQLLHLPFLTPTYGGKRLPNFYQAPTFEVPPVPPNMEWDAHVQGPPTRHRIGRRRRTRKRRRLHRCCRTVPHCNRASVEPVRAADHPLRDATSVAQS